MTVKRIPWHVFIARLAAISARTPVERVMWWLQE